MKVVFPVNQKTIRIRIPNVFILNRFTFRLLKIIFGVKYYPLVKIRYKDIKPVIKKAKTYKGFEIVTINTRQGENIVIYL